MEIKYVCPECGVVPLKEVHLDQHNPNWHTRCGSSILVKVVSSAKSNLSKTKE